MKAYSRCTETNWSLVFKKWQQTDNFSSQISKVMVWGAISVRGFYLKTVDGPGNIHEPKYCHILGEFFPYADALFPEGWILQQDGARPHTSNFTKN